MTVGQECEPTAEIITEVDTVPHVLDQTSVILVDTTVGSDDIEPALMVLPTFFTMTSKSDLPIIGAAFIATSRNRARPEVTTGTECPLGTDLVPDAAVSMMNNPTASLVTGVNPAPVQVIVLVDEWGETPVS